MSLLAPTLEAYFTLRLRTQKNASDNTVASYRDCWRLLLGYAHGTTGKQPSALSFDDLDAPVVGAFLDHLERDRHMSIASRNVRLAAVRSFFRFAALQHPEHSALIGRVLSIPAKRAERALVCFLTPEEVDALSSARTERDGLVAGTTPCLWLPFRPACGSRSSPGYADATCTSAQAHMCPAPARAGKNGARR